MDNSILNTTVSAFRDCKSTFPQNVSLLTWLTSDKHRDKVEQIRSIQDDNLQKVIKSTLPSITPSGVFSARSVKGFVEHSGFLAFDIDFKDNKHILNFDNLRDEISHIQSVAYCGLSVRGKGFWGLVPIPKSTPEIHRKRFKALERDFRQFGIIIDPSGSDITRLRIYSWDPQAYFNHKAVLYTKILEPQQRPSLRPSFTDTRERVEAIIEKIKLNKADITGDYKEEWFKIGCALSAEFGVDGRGYFHAVSQFHPRYDQGETDRQFDHCLKHNYDKINIGSFFHIAENYNLRHELVPVRQEGKVMAAALPKKAAIAPPLPDIIRSGPWDGEIKIMTEFFKNIKLPEGPIRLSSVETIHDVTLFVDSELAVLRYQNGNSRYLPDLERLQALKTILSN